MRDDMDDDRRGFLKCMAWVGTWVLWSLSSGRVLSTEESVPPELR